MATPIVSLTATSSQPMSSSRAATRPRVPTGNGAFVRAAKRRREIAADAQALAPGFIGDVGIGRQRLVDALLMFLRLNVSDAAAKIATSGMPASIARVETARLGTSARYRVPSRRVTARATSTASAICGTHFGLTNAVISTTGRPAAARASMNAILVAVGRIAASFCRPSRGPTSTMVTRRGRTLVGHASPRVAFRAARARRAGRRPTFTTPSSGARSGSSIFIASRITTVSPRTRSAWRNEHGAHRGRHRRRQPGDVVTMLPGAGVVADLRPIDHAVVTDPRILTRARPHRVTPHPPSTTTRQSPPPRSLDREHRTPTRSGHRAAARRLTWTRRLTIEMCATRPQFRHPLRADPRIVARTTSPLARAAMRSQAATSRCGDRGNGTPAGRSRHRPVQRRDQALHQSRVDPPGARRQDAAREAAEAGCWSRCRECELAERARRARASAAAPRLRRHDQLREQRIVVD